MKKKSVLFGLAAAALALSGAAAALPGADASPTTAASGVIHARHVCTTHPAPGFMSCLAVQLVDANGKAAAPIPAGFTPTDVQAAYNLKGLKSHGATVAIVDAYGYSTLESDLKAYRANYGLPDCTTKNGCLQIMDEHGGDQLPPDNAAWDLEQALDVDAVSATCPDCKIIMVQARSASGNSLGIAVDTAAEQKGVVAISNSYIGHQKPNMPEYNHPGIAITAGTGDSGYAPANLSPAADSHVIAVSGTSVVKDGSQRGYTETAWSGTGSGCSEENKKPTWQTKYAKTTCDTKAVGDVSAAANPSAGGLIIYYHGAFTQVGGTSEATPIIASVYALSGNTGGYPARFPYQSPKELYDITAGTNGSCGVPICTARKGWHGVTGIGTPNGVAGF